MLTPEQVAAALGPNLKAPAVHNAVFHLIALYGAMLADKDRECDLLRAELRRYAGKRDRQDEARPPGAERGREKPLGGRPDQGAGGEAPRAGGDVQEEGEGGEGGEADARMGALERDEDVEVRIVLGVLGDGNLHRLLFAGAAKLPFTALLRRVRLRSIRDQGPLVEVVLKNRLQDELRARAVFERI